MMFIQQPKILIGKSNQSLQKIDGKYEMSKFIDRGRDAEIYQGEIQGLPVAIKIYKEKITDQELEFLKILKSNSSSIKNLINILDIIENENVVVMELAEGNLANFLGKNYLIEKREINRFFYQIVQGVAELHNLGYFHRDLKPQNILYQLSKVGKKITFKLCDYGGLAKVANPESRLRTANVGTYGFTAPESLGNQYDENVDIWSLGIIWCLMHKLGKIQNLQSNLKNPKFINDSQQLTLVEKELMKRIFKENPKERIQLIQLKEQLWKIIDDDQDEQIIEQKKIEENQQLKFIEQERIEELQKPFNDIQRYVLNLINVSLNMLVSFLKSLQLKKEEQQNSSFSADHIKYIQQIDNYIQEIKDQIALIETDLGSVTNINYGQKADNHTIQNYSRKYSKMFLDFVLYKQKINQHLAQIYQNILSRKLIQEEDARQLKQIQEQQFGQIQQLQGQFKYKLDELNKINYYFLQKIQEKESLSKFYEPFDKQQKLSTIIVKLKQDTNYFSFLNLNFGMLIQEQQDNISQIQILQFNLQQLQSYESKSKELYGELENFVKIQEAIEQDIKNNKRKLIEDCLDQLDYFQANGEFLNLEFQINQSLYVQQLIKSIQEKMNSLEQIKRYLTEQLNQSNINPQTISLELQQINEKVQYCQQNIAQIQESKKQLESALAEARLLDQFNKQKIILIEKTKQKINQHSQVIQNLINTISQLAKECQFQVDKSAINQKIQYLEQINLNAQNTCVQITMVSEFKSQQEFEQFKQALDKFVLKNQEIVKAEEISVKDLKKSFQQLMLKEQNESEQLFSQAQQLYETITSSLIEFQQEYDQFKQFPQISQIKEFHGEQQLLEDELKKLYQMLDDGKDDLQIIKDKIITKNKQTIESLRIDSIGIFNKYKEQLEINIKQLQEKLSELNQIQIPLNYLHYDYQSQLEKFQKEDQYIQSFQQQLNLNFTQLQNLKGQSNEQLKIQSKNFLLQFQKWQDYEKKNIDAAINQWKRFDEMLNKQLESFIITKMIVNLIKLFNAKRYAQKLNQEQYKTKKMSDTKKAKFQEKMKSDAEKYQRIMNFEQQIVSKYKLWFRPHQLMNLTLENTINNIQEERQKADGYLGEMLGLIKAKYLIKLKKSLTKEEDIKMIFDLLHKLEFVQGKIIIHLCN